ncbi:hypothetical protein F2Q69_00048881 [Brassica cretica]|uniref:Uncharacterized protein n=1 Tax=Brassica cretica TaxID=69181 RepID=A0A8S9PIS0_BRACR|nr:hypothetical protein F2Q69_00048881 [Brassica cretica]
MVPEQLRSNLSSSILSSVESDGAHLHLALRLIRRIELDSSCSSVGYSAGLSRRRSARISISDYLCIASIDLSSSRLIPLWIYCFTWSRLLMIDAELRIVTYDLITEIFEMHIWFLISLWCVVVRAVFKFGIVEHLFQAASPIENARHNPPVWLVFEG